MILKRFLFYTTVILFCVYMFVIYFNGDINLYINPRFNTLTIAMVFVAFVVSAAGVYYSFVEFIANKSDQNKISISLKEVFVGILWSFILFVIYFVPAQRLSDYLFDQRASSLNAISTNNVQSILEKFGGSTEKYTIADWINLINNNPDINNYVGKRVKIDGFITKVNGTNTDIFRVSRFAVTCCVIDSVPIGIVASYRNWENEFEVDTWVEVVGEFSIQNIAGAEQLVVVVEEIEKIEEPNNPYIF